MNAGLPPVDDPLDGAPIRCTVEMAGDGTVMLERSAGCTPLDAFDLCAMIVRGARVVDRTQQDSAPWA